MNKNLWDDTWEVIYWGFDSKKDVLAKVENLIAMGANLEARNSNGNTVLMLAAMHGYTEIVEKLIVAGADVNAKNNEGKKAFDLAEKEEVKKMLMKEEVIKELLVKAEQLTQTPSERHALAETLNELRYDFGDKAKSIAEDSKKVKVLRERMGNKR